MEILHRSQLALLGGTPVRNRPFPEYNTIGAEERQAVMKVLDSGTLSGFLGTWSDQFYGGPRVRELEERWCAHFGSKHAISVNSATSGLYAAVAALGLAPGDEVIVSPYTMSASASGVLLYGGVPVFADIDPDMYCISAATIRKVLTARTKAIIIVDIFGQPADFDPIREVANEQGLILIEDAAQAPGAKYRGRWAGCLGHMGVFSLNFHKTIHSGEGGVIVTDDDEFAERLMLVRNHAEAVVKEKGRSDLGNLIGFNYRMTEIQAAIAIEQLRKLETLARRRTEAAQVLTKRWANLSGLTPAWVQPDCRHTYYVLAVQYDETVTGVSRERFLAAVAAEGLPLSAGYVEPLYLQPLYQQRARAEAARAGSTVARYELGTCPTAELMHFTRLYYTHLFHPGLSQDDLEDVARAVEKVAAAQPALAASAT